MNILYLKVSLAMNQLVIFYLSYEPTRTGGGSNVNIYDLELAGELTKKEIWCWLVNSIWCGSEVQSRLALCIGSDPRAYC